MTYLDNSPKRTPTVPYEPWSSRDMRRINVDSYAIFYLIDENHERVQIIVIPYGAMDLEKLFEEEIT